MDPPGTPIGSRRLENDNSNSPFVVPPTPLLKTIGWGTGVAVYHMDRSPFSGLARSPWALKKVCRNNRRKNFVGHRLALEADILQKLNHPNIVGYRCFTKTKDGREVLAMEQCEQSLGTIIENRYEAKEGPIDAQLILKIVYEITKALRYIHTVHRIIHGDVKSYNVLIKGNYDAIKLCDFGVSFPLNDEGVASDYIGTEVWSAPEVNEEGPVTVKADIYSLGLTIWEMVALIPPCTNDEDMNDSSSFNSTNSQTRPEFPRGLNESYRPVEQLYQWCSEFSMDQRPTADEIIAFIDNLPRQ